MCFKYLEDRTNEGKPRHGVKNVCIGGGNWAVSSVRYTHGRSASQSNWPVCGPDQSNLGYVVTLQQARLGLLGRQRGREDYRLREAQMELGL